MLLVIILIPERSHAKVKVNLLKRTDLRKIKEKWSLISDGTARRVHSSFALVEWYVVLTFKPLLVVFLEIKTIVSSVFGDNGTENFILT